MGFYKNKNVLVAGGSGLIGRYLVDSLIDSGASVRIASIDDPTRAHPKAEFFGVDLTDYSNCLKSCKDMDYVFNLLCVKGNPKVMKEHPARFFDPMILFNTNLLKAARNSKVDRYLFTSSIGVYAPAEVFNEDDVWKTFPSENDRFAGWAKRMGELQAQAYTIDYGWDKISIVRPANTYGPFDDFSSENSMVVPSLIKRAVSGENPMVVWGDGSSIRDFVHARDVARGISLTLEKGITPNYPINLGCGQEKTIRDLVEVILANLDTKPEVIWDTSKPSGDRKRLMNVSRAKELLNWQAEISLEEGVKETMQWYFENKNKF